MTSSFKLHSVKPLFAIIIMVLSVYGCAQKITSPSAPANEVKPPEGISAGSAKKMESPQVAEGKTIYTTKCARCHGVKPVQDWTVHEWIPIMERMAPKARLDETEIANVTAYVNFYAKSGS